MLHIKENGFFIDLEDEKIYKSRSDINPVLEKAIKNGMLRNDLDTAKQALIQIKLFTKLLALRDQECPDSRGYIPQKGNKKYFIYKNIEDELYYTKNACNTYEPDKIYFKNKEEAEKICNILNSNEFDLKD